MVWAGDNLGSGRCADIFRGLVLTIDHEERGELFARCPLHDDHKASLSYSPAKDLYHCFGCGAGGDLVDLFARLNGLDKAEGLRQFKAKYSAPGAQAQARRPNPGSQQSRGAGRQDQGGKIIPEAEWRALPPLPEAWLKRLEVERGWTREVMARLDLRLAQAHKAARVAIPVRDERGRLVNVRQYLPKAKENKVISWGRGYGLVRLLPHPTAWPAQEPLFLAEGEPDWICALSHGLNAVCPTGGAGTFKPQWAPAFAGRDVVIVYDNDKAGREGAAKAAREMAPHARRVRVVRWPQNMGPGEDLTDWLVKYGRNAEELLALAEEITPQADESEDFQNLRRFHAWSQFDEKVNYRPMLLVQEIISERPITTDRATGLSYWWTGKVWRPVTVEELRRLAGDKLDFVGTRNKVAEAAELIRCITILPEGQPMNPDPDWLCCANGMVNINTWDVAPHDPKYRCTYGFPWPFDPADPTDCPRFKRYLAEVGLDDMTAATLQEFSGYCLWAQNPFKKALFLVGPGNTGKSVFLNVLQALVGEENCANINIGDLQDQFLRVTLHQRSLNVFTEADAKFFTSDYFKAIVGGDRLTAAYKHLQAFEFRPHCKLAFSMNSFPRVSDSSSAFYGRILPVAFNRVFGPGEADPELEQELKQELPGIFCWAMVGLARLRERGYFDLSPASRRLLNEFRYETNPVQGFLEECCTTRPFLNGAPPWADKQDLYDAYADWSKKNGYQPRSRNSLFRTIKDLEPGIREARPTVDGNRTRRLEGLRLLEATP